MYSVSMVTYANSHQHGEPWSSSWGIKREKKKTKRKKQKAKKKRQKKKQKKMNKKRKRKKTPGQPV